MVDRGYLVLHKIDDRKVRIIYLNHLNWGHGYMEARRIRVMAATIFITMTSGISNAKYHPQSEKMVKRRKPSLVIKKLMRQIFIFCMR